MTGDNEGGRYGLFCTELPTKHGSEANLCIIGPSDSVGGASDSSASVHTLQKGSLYFQWRRRQYCLGRHCRWLWDSCPVSWSLW